MLPDPEDLANGSFADHTVIYLNTFIFFLTESGMGSELIRSQISMNFKA